MNSVELKKIVYPKSNYKSLVNTNFSQLITSSVVIPEKTVEEKTNDFFQLYEELFYYLPETGSRSHEYIIQNSSNYINYQYESDTINALLQEINQLKQQILDNNSNL